MEKHLTCEDCFFDEACFEHARIFEELVKDTKMTNHNSSDNININWRTVEIHQKCISFKNNCFDRLRTDVGKQRSKLNK